MKVDERARKSVVFVGIDTGTTFVPIGTGFLTGVEYRGLTVSFVVTARHVIEPILGANIALRVNLVAGGCRLVPMPSEKWKAHGDGKVDLAFCHVALDPAIFDLALMATDMDRLAKAKSNYPAEVGDEVFAIGLYTSHHGQTRNIPIVRIGHVAAKPEEPIWMGRGFVDGYLIELRSIAGLSGSPVFLHRPAMYLTEQGPWVSHGDFYYLLGVLIGHHVIESAEDDIVVPQDEGEPLKARLPPDQRNTGFGVVIPIERVTEDLSSDETMGKIRKDVDTQLDAQGFQTDQNA